MALVLKDRVKESSTTTGLGSYTLNGAEAGFQSFAAVGNGNTTYYAATDGTSWEVGIGTYTLSGTSLSRDTILSSSNSGQKVNWTNGEKLVFVTMPSSKSVHEEADGKIASGQQFAGYVDLAAIQHPTHAEGRVFYDTTHKALAVYNDEADITLEVGQESWVRVYNTSGATIGNGKPVYVSGHSAGYPLVSLANATSESSYDAIGLATHDIENNSYGYVSTFGVVRDINTAALTAGEHVFVGLTDGTLTSTAPTYPSFPITLGWCLVSHATTGSILVTREANTINGLRVVGNAYVGNDLTVGGNLTVIGSQTVASSTNVSIGAAMQYLNAGDTIGDANTVFTGTGLDDATFTGHYNGPDTRTFYVAIDGEKTGTGGVDTFKWSYNSDLSSPQATGVNMVAGANALAYGISISFAADKNHHLGDKWSGAASPINIDTGVWSNRNTGVTGVGYTHLGWYFDVSDAKFKFVSEYDPEPEGTIDATHASFTLGTIKAGTFEGALSGNATTATTLQTGRTIGLTGDVSGSAVFNGGSDISITATVANDSHTHSDYLQKSGGTMTGTLTASTIAFGDWEIKLSGTSLIFAYGGANKFRLDTTGTLSVTNDILTDETL